MTILKIKIITHNNLALIPLTKTTILPSISSSKISATQLKSKRKKMMAQAASRNKNNKNKYSIMFQASLRLEKSLPS